MAYVRMIERWLPIGAISEESVRERRSMTALPPTYYLHIWWARRPLVASRAAVLASLLPVDADRERFLHAIGIHGDPVAAKRRIAAATSRGERLGAAAYGYPRAFKHSLNATEHNWLSSVVGDATVLDPTAGGGSVPIESLRLGFETTANDLNPVAVLIERATLDWTARFGKKVRTVFEELGATFVARIRSQLRGVFPEEPLENTIPDGYLYARSITCPYCEGLVPLSPNWRLAPSGIGVRLRPDLRNGPGAKNRACSFEIVESAQEQSPATIARGDGICPYSDCERVIDGDEIKRQAQEGVMGEQLFAIVYKRRVRTMLKSGRFGKDKWERGYRAPRSEDENGAQIQARLEEKLPEWRAFDMVPSESYDDMHCDRSKIYGVTLWRDMFSPRQLLCHSTSVEVFRELLEADRSKGKLSEIRKAAYGYLAIALDTVLTYNNRSSRWDSGTQRVRSNFDRHDFAFVWSFAEMAPLVTGAGYDWAIKKTAKCIDELVKLTCPETDALEQLPFDTKPESPNLAPPPVTITCQPGHSLDHIPDGSVDAVVMDPPYYDNVMYAELSDFFYVWLKRTAGHVFPDLFRLRLTNKDSEAVANPMRFRGQKGARELAGLDYQDRMADIFGECRRTLKPDGILTLMFTHKASGAWDALTKGLIEAGFVITASWPINTEASGSLHIKDKAAANSTVFLVCRPREERADPDETVYWEHVEPKVAAAVRARVAEFQAAGITGVDLYLASFGPALEEFSRNWPLERGYPRRRPEPSRKSRQAPPAEEKWNPYAVTPEDALDVARREVKRWRLEKLTHLKAQADLDPPTAFFVLAWDAFRAPVFSYDEALRLARAVGVDLEREVVNRLAEKKGSNLRLWDSSQRAAKGALRSADGSRGMIHAIQHAAHAARKHNAGVARDLLADTRVDQDPRFFAALEAVLEVLPVSSHFSGVTLEGELAASGDDFEALYNLYRLAFSDKMDEPEQLKLWRDD